MADIPHFSFPFNFETVNGKKQAGEQEQDELDEIVSSIELILRTPVGWRDDREEFGRPDYLFTTRVDGEELRTIVYNQEDRAQLATTSEVDPFDIAVRNIGIEVSE